MSYCRWSSDDWKCDIYCYESNAGYEVHVANRKRVGEFPIFPSILDIQKGKLTNKEYLKQYKEADKKLKAMPLVDIGLEYDGESFILSTLKELKDCLIMLQEEGYHVPDWIISEIEMEMEGE